MPKPTSKARITGKDRPKQRNGHPAILARQTRPKPAAGGGKSKTQYSEPNPQTKTGRMVALLRRPQGASLGELVKATDWLENSVRGALSGTIRKKLGLQLQSTRTGKIRRYRLVNRGVTASAVGGANHD